MTWTSPSFSKTKHQRLRGKCPLEDVKSAKFKSHKLQLLGNRLAVWHPINSPSRTMKSASRMSCRAMTQFNDLVLDTLKPPRPLGKQLYCNRLKNTCSNRRATWTSPMFKTLANTANTFSKLPKPKRLNTNESHFHKFKTMIMKYHSITDHQARQAPKKLPITDSPSTSRALNQSGRAEIL